MEKKNRAYRSFFLEGGKLCPDKVGYLSSEKSAWQHALKILKDKVSHGSKEKNHPIKTSRAVVIIYNTYLSSVQRH